MKKHLFTAASLVSILFFAHCKKNIENSSLTPIFQATINGSLWQADSSHSIESIFYSDTSFIITGSSSDGRLIRLMSHPPASSSIDFGVSSVTLSSFTGSSDLPSNTIHLNWTTIKEINTEKFIIERSTDAVTFETAGEIAAAGNSSQELKYSWDEKPPVYTTLQKPHYYRIKILNTDSTFEYSSVLAVTLESPALYIFGLNDHDYGYGYNGSLTITKVDDANKLVNGTFYFTITDNSGSTIKVINGKFQNIPFERF